MPQRSTEQKGEGSEIPFIDLSNPRPRRLPGHAPHIQRLIDIKAGHRVKHNHRSYRTPFSKWIAQKRYVHGCPFRYSVVVGAKGQYVISVDPAFSQAKRKARAEVRWCMNPDGNQSTKWKGLNSVNGKADADKFGSVQADGLIEEVDHRQPRLCIGHKAKSNSKGNK
jgi:hypothetical protein